MWLSGLLCVVLWGHQCCSQLLGHSLLSNTTPSTCAYPLSRCPPHPKRATFSFAFAKAAPTQDSIKLRSHVRRHCRTTDGQAAVENFLQGAPRRALTFHLPFLSWPPQSLLSPLLFPFGPLLPSQVAQADSQSLSLPMRSTWAPHDLSSPSRPGCHLQRP